MIRRLKDALTREVTLPSLPPLTPRLLLLYWLLAALVLFLPLPWITQVQLYGNSDSLFYTNILAFISERLQHGELFPRWFADANAGISSTAMLLYAPLAYTITAILNAPFAWLHPSIGTQFLLGIYISQLAGALTSYLWLKRQFPTHIAFIGSLMFVLLPYKLIYIYLHFNLAQLWALAFMPVWLIAAEEICEEALASPALYALALAGTYYCHPLTVLAFGLIPACYVLLMAPAERRIACYARLLIAHILAAGICIWQAYPQFVYRDWIHTDEFLKGRLHWEGNFFHIDVFLCFYYGIAAFLVWYGAWRLPSLFSSPTRRTIFFWASVIVITVFMTQRMSNPLWQHIPPLQYLQFPAARLHAGAMFAAIYLICIWLVHADGLRPLGPTVYRPSLILIFILFFTGLTICRVKNLYVDGTLSSKDYIGDAQIAQIIPVPEYKTAWGCGDAGKALAMYRTHTIPPLVQIKEGAAKLRHIEWDPPYNIALQVNVTSSQAGIVLRQCYVPLWQAVDEKGGRLPVTWAAGDGMLHVTVPKGEHSITVSLSQPTPLKVARSISICSALLAGLWLLLRVLGWCPSACKKS